MLRVSTGEEWYSIMYDCRRHSPVAAYFYFSTFNVVTSFIMLNMFVMITVQALTDNYENPESPIDVFNKTVKQFKAVWARYSTLYRGVKMHNKLLEDLLRDLGPPLAPISTGSKLELAKIITALDIPMDEGGYVYYHDTLFCILKRYFGNFRFQRKDLFKKKIVLGEERKTLVQINKITQKLSRKRNVYFSSREKFMSKGVCTNAFSSYYTLKKIVTYWKIFTDEKKELCSCRDDVSIRDLC